MYSFTAWYQIQQMNLVTSDTCRILLSCCCRCYSVSPVSSSLEGWCHQIMGNVSLTNQLGTHAEMSVLILLLVVEFWLPVPFLSFRMEGQSDSWDRTI